jgi:hypothetical protein
MPKSKKYKYKKSVHQQSVAKPSAPLSAAETSLRPGPSVGVKKASAQNQMPRNTTIGSELKVIGILGIVILAAIVILSIVLK